MLKGVICQLPLNLFPSKINLDQKLNESFSLSPNHIFHGLEAQEWRKGVSWQREAKWVTAQPPLSCPFLASFTPWSVCGTWFSALGHCRFLLLPPSLYDHHVHSGSGEQKGLTRLPW